MNKQNIFNLIFLIGIPTLLFPQRKIIEDFNGDKIKDTCFVTIEKAYKNVSIPSLNFDFSHEYSLASLTDSICLSSLKDKKLSNFGRERILQQFLLAKKKIEIDPSFEFLKSLIKITDERDVKFYYEPKWYKKLVQPESYYLDSKIISSSNERCYIKYNGHNLKHIDSLKLKNNVNLLIYSHGVIVQKGEEFSWCFIGDDKINPNIEKLRWSTINFITSINHREELILSQKTTPNNVILFYKINYQKGVIEPIFQTTEEVDVNTVANKIEFKSKSSSAIIKVIEF